MSTRGLSQIDGVFKTLADLIAYKANWKVGQKVVIRDTGARWIFTGNTGATSQSPSQLGEAKLHDGSGNEFALDFGSYIKPEWVGAVGDKVADDGLAVIAALASGNIRANKDYFVGATAGIVVPSNRRITGNGGFYTNSAAASRGIFDVSNNSNIKIKYVTLQSLRAGDTIAVDNTAIRGDGCSDVEIVGTKIKDFGYYGVELRNATDCQVWGNNRITNVGRAGFLGIGCTRVHVHRNFIKDVSPGSGGVAPFINAFGIVLSMVENSGETRSSHCSAVGNHIENVPSWEGIDTHGGTDLLIEDNTFINCAIGAFIGSATGTANLPPERIKLVDNNFVNTGNPISRAGILLSATPDGGITVGHDFTIRGNYIEGHGTHDIAETQEGALDIGFARSVNVVGNNFNNNRYAHIRLKEDIISCVINGGNTFRRGIVVDGQVWVLNAQNATDIDAIFEGNVAYREGGTLNGVWVQAAPGSSAFGVKMGVNEFNGLSSDFESNSIARLHESSEIFLINTTQCKIASTGTIRNDKNVTSINKTGTGTYELNLTSAYLSANNINCVVSAVGNNARICNATPLNGSTIEVKVFDITGSLVDNEFQLQASGRITEMV